MFLLFGKKFLRNLTKSGLLSFKNHRKRVWTFEIKIPEIFPLFLLLFLYMSLDSLNPEQRKVAETIYGPILVLAGPGTGKTHMLTARISHILSSGVGAHAQNILCLTFTDSAAKEMRDRLQKTIGAEAYNARISTFHGFCQWIMDSYQNIFQEKVRGKSVADDLQKALSYQEAIMSRKWEHFSSVWDELYARIDVLGAISSLKREGATPKDVRKRIPEERALLEADPENFYKKNRKEFKEGDWKPAKKQKIDQKIAKLSEFVDLWEVYEECLHAKNLFDFDDQIQWVKHELQKNETLRYDLQEQFQWILVDEYQDTNTAQNSILWALTEGVDQPNIMAVGDDDQSIYRFQGASIANIEDFQNRFPDRLEVALVKNYRSTQSVLDTAYASVKNNTERINPEKTLEAQKTNSGSLIKASFGSQYSEINFLVQKSQEFFVQGISPSEIAILVRKNSEIEMLARELPKFGIPVSAQISQNIFDDPFVSILINMAEVFRDPKHDEKLFDLLHAECFGIPPEELLRISLLRQSKRTSFVELFLESSESFSEPLKNAFSFFITSRSRFWHLRPPVLVEKLLYESGIADFLTRTNNIRGWNSVRKFIDWIREQKQDGLAEIQKRIALHKDLGIAIRPDLLPSDKRAVRIMTAHKSKGLEFEVVFLPGLENQKWGNPRKKSFIHLPRIVDQKDHDENEEERRLFFVALTRAKSHIVLSYSKTNMAGKSKNPSPFWHEVPENIVQDLSSDEAEEDVQKLLPVFLQHQEKTFTQTEKEILQTRVSDFIWSASALQNYLDCPRRFLYQNLYKFPRRPLPQLALGVALHQALELFFREAKSSFLDPRLREDEEGKKFLFDQYEYALRGQNLPKEDFEKWFEHGKEVLDFYYEQNLRNFLESHPYGYELEYTFKSHNVRASGIGITGVLDKVVYLDEGKKRVKIVDYKSGTPKPITPGERRWRQLVFYDLLVHHDPKNSWEIDSLELDFLTADKSGKLGTRSYQVTPADRQQVLEELQSAHKALQNLEFPAVLNPSGDKDIEFWNTFGR